MTEALSIDLHPIFRSERDIDRAVRNVVFRAARESVPRVEIIVGRGKGKLRNRVITMLNAPHFKRIHRSVEVDPRNDGKVIVHF